MSCPNTLTNISVSCEGSAGGIKKVLIAPKSAVVIPDLNNGVLDASAFKAATTGAVFVEYAFRPETASMTSTSASDRAIGSSSVTTQLSLQFTRMEKTKRVAVQQAINTGSIVIVEDYNGEHWFLGYDMPVYTTEATAVTGQAIGDLNGYTLTLEDISFELPYPVSGTAAEFANLVVSLPTA